MYRILTRTAIPAAALLILAGCSSTTTKSNPAPTPAPTSTTAPSPTGPTTGISPGSTPAAAAQITIDNFAFSPADLTVRPGQTVTVVNNDSATHTLTAGTGNTFDTGPINPGKSATFTAPATAGTYPYVCSIHSNMHGTLTVG